MKSSVYINFVFILVIQFYTQAKADVYNLGDVKVGTKYPITQRMHFTQCWRNHHEDAGWTQLKAIKPGSDKVRIYPTPTSNIMYEVRGKPPSDDVTYYRGSIEASTGVITNLIQYENGNDIMKAERNTPTIPPSDDMSTEWVYGVWSSGWDGIRHTSPGYNCGKTNGKYSEFTIPSWTVDTTGLQVGVNYQMTLRQTADAADTIDHTIQFVTVDNLIPSCQVTVPTSIDLGTMRAGTISRKDFKISFRCKEAVSADVGFFFNDGSTVFGSMNEKVKIFEESGSYLEIRDADDYRIRLNDEQAYGIAGKSVMQDNTLYDEFFYIMANNELANVGGVFSKTMTVIVTVH